MMSTHRPRGIMFILIFISLSHRSLSTDVACRLLTMCDSCRERHDCTWCFIARGQPRCDPISSLSKSGNECIRPLFDDGLGSHQNACIKEWSKFGHVSFENTFASRPSNPPHPLGLILKSPTFGQQLIGTTKINPLVEIQLLGGMPELHLHDELCFWVHSSSANETVHNIETITSTKHPTSCNNKNQIMSGTLKMLNIPLTPSSYLIIAKMISSHTNLPRSGSAYTLIDRYPIEIYEWGDLFREDYLSTTPWWNDRIDQVSPKTFLGPSTLYHNRGSHTSRQLNKIPISTSNRRHIPKIIHQIWTGGIEELETFEEELPVEDKKHWFKQWRDSCLKLHPKKNGWKHMFWDTKSMRAFVFHNFPQMIQQYDQMDLNIKRTDLARMLILLVYGGTYVDIDFECLKPFETIIKYGNNDPLESIELTRQGPASMTEFSEGTLQMQIMSRGSGTGGNSTDRVPLLYLSEHQTNLPASHILKGRELPNAFMASIEFHPLIWLITMEMLRRDFVNPRGYVTQITGPHVFSEIAFSYLEKYNGANIQMLPIRALFPVYCLDKNEMRLDTICIQNYNCSSMYPDSVAVHHYAASWYPDVAIHLGI